MKRLGILSVLLAVLLAVLAVAAPAQAAAPPPGATWSESWIPTPDGEKLHVDLLRPAGLEADDKTPVILIVSPYLGASAGNEAPGPSNRFYDLFNGADVFAK